MTTIPKELENQILKMDCLEGLSMIPDGSIDLILCDPPYGVTDCPWDTPLPMDRLWQAYERVIKPNGAILLTGVQPFTTALIQSNRKNFRYCWYWKKNSSTGFANSNKQPLRCIEDVAVFYKHKPTYRPQGLQPLPQPKEVKGSRKGGNVYKELDKSYTRRYTNYPKNLLEIPVERGLHPTQKPVALFEYLIRTYTDPGQIVLDSCMGSGTTAIACIRSGRRYIGFEQDATYWQVCQDRIAKETQGKRR